MKRLQKFRYSDNTSEGKVVDSADLTKDAKVGDFIVDSDGDNLGDFNACLDNTTIRFDTINDSLIIRNLDQNTEKESVIAIKGKEQVKALKEFLAKIPT